MGSSSWHTIHWSRRRWQERLVSVKANRLVSHWNVSVWTASDEWVSSNIMIIISWEKEENIRPNSRPNRDIYLSGHIIVTSGDDESTHSEISTRFWLSLVSWVCSILYTVPEWGFVSLVDRRLDRFSLWRFALLARVYCFNRFEHALTMTGVLPVGSFFLLRISRGCSVRPSQRTRFNWSRSTSSRVEFGTYQEASAYARNLQIALFESVQSERK